MKRHIFFVSTALLLAVLLFADISGTASAASSGTCGENLTWRLSDTGVLTISGTGAMDNYVWSESPWYSNHDISQVVIENGVTSIGGGAFVSCIFMTSISIPDSVTSIGQAAFDDCWSLTSVTLPDKLTCIKNITFQGCVHLQSITIPVSVKEIGEAAFNNCDTLRNVYYNGNDSQWAAIEIEGWNGALFACKPQGSYRWNLSADGVLTITGSGRMPDYCHTSSAPWSGVSGQVKSLVIGEGITGIGSYAFTDCLNLQSVSFPSSLRAIYGNAFYDSFYPSPKPSKISYNGTALQYNMINKRLDWCLLETASAYTFTDSSIQWSLEDGTLTLNGSGSTAGFAPWVRYASAHGNDNGRDMITHLVIGPGITKLGSMFDDYNNLTNVTLLDGVTSIGEYAFNGLSSLTNITIPNSVTSIGEWAFAGCSGLTSITLPKGVTSIGDCAFFLCSGLKDIAIPDSVSLIGQGAFYNCSSVANITIPNSVTSIGAGAFDSCSGLKSIIIPNSVTSIGGSAFGGCSNLASLTIPNSVTSIGQSAFCECSSLKSISIPNSIVEIPSGAFVGCVQLREITIPVSVKKIDEWAFADCTTLTTVTLPASVTEIGEGAFDGCNNLSTVQYGGDKSMKNAISIGADNDCLLNAAWKYGETVYAGMKTLTLPGSVKTVESKAFTGTAAQVIIIPATCKSIASDAFAGCPNLRYIVNRSAVSITSPTGVELIVE